MTAEQTYINDVLAIALNQMANPQEDPYRPTWHFAPQFGLLNDPNGLAHFAVNITCFINGIQKRVRMARKHGDTRPVKILFTGSINLWR
ncbi:sucrose-6-phosphate hydrolase [Vibrio sp. JCM 19052]|nr:sucrose-6-phosphate hydrolase [Vibrio sp. JCM 19052]